MLLENVSESSDSKRADISTIGHIIATGEVPRRPIIANGAVPLRYIIATKAVSL